MKKNQPRKQSNKQQTKIILKIKNGKDNEDGDDDDEKLTIFYEALIVIVPREELSTTVFGLV